ncbi:hypothetical protein FA15DRAFT_753648 [Coprinopsis marcescibilis]|uniref:Uncharacterized protein n=1 Tax=Coprinopsis marcescibilis TaxID=230819 RepID=A0A5C3LIF2_COPMA|nr:hypothetical protein FA15DRAFT_753648 [Coprinopsis marcescibilis]
MTSNPVASSSKLKSLPVDGDHVYQSPGPRSKCSCNWCHISCTLYPRDLEDKILLPRILSISTTFDNDGDFPVAIPRRIQHLIAHDEAKGKMPLKKDISQSVRPRRESVNVPASHIRRSNKRHELGDRRVSEPVQLSNAPNPRPNLLRQAIHKQIDERQPPPSQSSGSLMLFHDETETVSRGQSQRGCIKEFRYYRPDISSGLYQREGTSITGYRIVLCSRENGINFEKSRKLPFNLSFPSENRQGSIYPSQPAVSLNQHRGLCLPQGGPAFTFCFSSD